MKQLNNDNAANRSSYVGYVYNVGEKEYKKRILMNLPKEWAGLHIERMIHIHDLSAYDLTYNCLTFDLINKFPYEEFKKFNEQGKIIHLFEFIKDLFTKLGNEQSGGMAFANFDNEISTILKSFEISCLFFNLAVCETTFTVGSRVSSNGALSPIAWLSAPTTP